MNGFTYYTPTKVVFGLNAESRVGALVKAQGCKKVLIHYGSGSVKRTGLLDRIKAALDEAGIAHVELGGVVPNPHLSKAREGSRSHDGLQRPRAGCGRRKCHRLLQVYWLWRGQ